MDGRVSGCIRVRAIPAGSYHVVLDQLPPTSAAAGPIKREPAKKLTPPVEPAVHLSLSPLSGTPGTTVEVTGELSSPLSVENGHADLCWDGCADGLQYEGVSLRWISPTVFRTHLVIPAAPWYEADPGRIQPLRSGSYPIGINCLVSAKECAFAKTEGSTTFSLKVGSQSKAHCSSSDCTRLTASPAEALPGQVVNLEGFAPLVSVIGSDQPFAFQFEMLTGAAGGPEVDFVKSPSGATELNLGHAALQVPKPTSFAALASTTPLAGTSAGLPLISAVPGQPDKVAWCSNGSVAVSTPGGETHVPTAAASHVLENLGFGLMGLAVPRCAAVALIPGSSQAGAALAVAFTAAPNGEAPPVADVALYSTDSGRSWTAVPVPPGATAGSFGGFAYENGDLEALYALSPASPAEGVTPNPGPLVEVAGPGGHTWSQGSFTCPRRGPCVSFGPYAPGNCAMNGTQQSVIFSSDSGLHWQEAKWPSTVDTCAPAQLLATSAKTELLLDSVSAYTLRLSSDGGKEWRYVSLPPLPGQRPGAGLGPGAGGIIALPSGSLLAIQTAGQKQAWELLARGATSWCQIGGVTKGTAATAGMPLAAVTVIGDQLWWLPGGGNPPPPAQHVPLKTLTCAGG